MFVDTSGFLCRYEPSEESHDKAVNIYDSSVNLLTSSYVLAEYTALAQVRGISRQHIISFSEQIIDKNEVEIVWVSSKLHLSAVKLLAERADKSYSLCDAVSFLIMRGRGITEALTTDRHFEQEGFVRLLK